ncbi:MAG: SNF2-related protein [Erysipelotrichaceae bacterium]
MRKIKLFQHQIDALEQTKGKDHVAYYLDMGLGKTFVGSEKMMQLGAKVNLVICQKSKIDDWVEHFEKHYNMMVYNLTKKKDMETFIFENDYRPIDGCVGVINYELAFRRPELKMLEDFTLMLDESSMIQNEQAKRSKFILKLQPKNVILLSGTPTGGKYEKLWSQCHLLDWPISKKTYWNQFIDTEIMDFNGFPIKIVKGYKNVERLKDKLRQHGAVFMKSDEVFDLPQQVDTTIKVSTTKEYRKFRKESIISLNTYKNQFIEWKDDSDFYGKDVTPHIELVGDTTLTKMLYERQLCGQYNKDKLNAFRDLLESTNDRLIVFYNFNDELRELEGVCGALDRPMSIVNGQIKDLTRYEYCDDTITFIQYQAGAMGLNLQKANKIVYFTPPLSSELFEQSKKRIHRIGQEKTCFYYYLTCRGSIEEKIYATLAMRKDYTERLFENESN